MRSRVWEIAAAAALALVLLSAGLFASIQHGARQAREQLRSELAYAASSGDLSRVDTLLKRGASPRGLDEHGVTPFYHAVARGHLEVARLLLQKGADPNHRGSRGAPPLMAAVQILEPASRRAMVRLLLESGADPDARDPAPQPLDIGSGPMEPADQTPLMRAVIQGKDDLVPLLLERGVDVNARDSTGRTALHWWALFRRHDPAAPALGRLLLKRGADPDLPDAAGEAPRQLVARMTDSRIHQVLPREPLRPPRN